MEVCCGFFGFDAGDAIEEDSAEENPFAQEQHKPKKQKQPLKARLERRERWRTKRRVRRFRSSTSSSTACPPCRLREVAKHVVVGIRK